MTPWEGTGGLARQPQTSSRNLGPAFAAHLRSRYIRRVLETIALSRLVIRDFSFSVERGERVAIDGPSGCGKTTLLRAMADLDPSTGDVRLDGVSRSALTGPQWRRQVMYVSSESAFWSARVGDHFEAFSGTTDGPETPSENRLRAVAMLERMGLSAETIDWPVNRLSSGEAQRVALARALLLCPPVLLLDEPTSNLDSTAQTQIESILNEAAQTGTHLVLVSHDANQRRRLSDRIIPLSNAAGASVPDREGADA
ncbi:MAG: ABC-type multidrug transport system ATPase subunit [Candidatus Binatia bacterium]|jgi:ABC-type multidrug transport system ATPase subunit